MASDDVYSQSCCTNSINQAERFYHVQWRERHFSGFFNDLLNIFLFVNVCCHGRTFHSVKMYLYSIWFQALYLQLRPLLEDWRTFCERHGSIKILLHFLFFLPGAFQLYDLDNDGSITRDEMLNIVEAIFSMVVSSW